MRLTAFSVGCLIIAVAGVFWALEPGDGVRLGIFAGAATGAVNVAMLWSRRHSAADMGLRAAVLWVRTNFVSRMAVMLLVLLLLQRQLGTSGDLAFLGGFFVVEAAVLVVLAREKG